MRKNIRLITVLTGFGLTVLVSGVIGCSFGAGQGNREGGVEKRGIEDVLKEHTPRLMAVKGVTGTAQGLCVGAPCILVYVLKKTPELEAIIPASIEGYPVEVRESGEFKAY